MKENLIELANNIEKHYLLKLNRKRGACFSFSAETVIKLRWGEISKEDLFILTVFLKREGWRYSKEINDWFSSIQDGKLKSIGVNI